jgi:hypothetical protein
VKKGLKIIGIVLIFIIIAFNLFKLPTYLEFKRYLKSNYPSKEFKVGWVEYNFIYGGTFSKVVSLEDDISFHISSGKNYIEDSYYITKHIKEMNEMLRENLFSENEELRNFIRSVYGGTNKLSDNEIKDYKPIVDTIGVSFYNDKIIDDRHLAELIHKVIHIYKKKNIQFNQISTDFEMENHVYVLMLKDEELDYDINKIVSSIRKIK